MKYSSVRLLVSILKIIICAKLTLIILLFIKIPIRNMFREAYDSLNSMHKLVPHQTLLRETTEFKDKSYLVKLVHPRDLHNTRETHFRKCVHELEWHTSINSEDKCRVAKGILSEFVKHGNSVSLEEVDQINPNLGQTLRSFSSIEEGLKAAKSPNVSVPAII